jgi:hypothetical protein
MKGKIAIVVGLAAGYVLGARAGRERYEQIKDAYLKVYNTPVVQKQVDKVAELGKSAAFAVPGALWDGAVKVTRAVTTKGTPGQKLDAALDATGDAAEDVKDAAEATTATAKSTTTKAPAKRTTTRKTTGTTKSAAPGS